MPDIQRARKLRHSASVQRKHRFPSLFFPLSLLGVGMILLLLLSLTRAVEVSSPSSGDTSATIVSSTPVVPLPPGTEAPDFSLTMTPRGVYHLAQQRGHSILLSFLGTIPDTASSSPSRSQAIFLESLEQQYASKGVEVVIIDATAIETGQQPALNSLLNVPFDWHLGAIPFLLDTSAHTVAVQYGILKTPTTYLINVHGTIEHCWDGLAQSAQLAFAIQHLTGL